MKCEHCGQDKVLHIKVEKQFICPKAVFKKLEFGKSSSADPIEETQESKELAAKERVQSHDLDLALNRSAKI